MTSHPNPALASTRRHWDLALQIMGFGTPILTIAGLTAAQQPQINFYDVDRYPMALAVSDLTGDALPDILTPCRDSANDIALLVNKGSGTFDPAQFIFSGTSPRAITTADLNQDGWMDFVACNQDQTIAVFINKQDGTFLRSQYAVEVQQPYQGQQPRFVKAGDLDGDGDLDLIIPVATHDYYENWWGLTTFTNDGAGNFTQNQVQVVEGLNTVTGFEVGDLDDDGDLDIVLGVFDYHPCQQPYCYDYHAEGQKLALLTNNGFANPFTITDLNINSLTDDVAASDIALVDIDGDGDRDIVTRIANFQDSVDFMTKSTNTIQILRNNGNAAFDPAQTIWTQPNTRGHGLAVSDLDLDGDIDILLSTTSGRNNPAYLFTLFNDGSGNNFTEQPFNLGLPQRYPLAVAATDISGDGLNDIIASFSDPDTVMTLINPLKPTGPKLDLSPQIVRGQSVGIDISNAPAGKPLYLLYSFDDPAPSLGLKPLGGLTIDIPDSSTNILTSGTTDENGTAHFTIKVPNSAPLHNFTIQAVIRNGPKGTQSQKTNYQTRRIQP